MMEHYNYVVLRTPTQSLKNAYNFTTDISPIICEGLYLASVDFWNEFQKKEQLPPKEKEKLVRSFSKYWLRSAARCTPYGTFAGCTLLSVGDAATGIVLDENRRHTRSIRVDMNYVTAIITALTQPPHISSQLKFYPNNSIYEVPGGFRYAEYSVRNDVRNYQLTSVSNAHYIRSILQKAVQGATIRELCELLAAEADAGIDEATAFVGDMVQAQLLLPELEPCVTGPEPLDALTEQLGSLEGTEDIVEKLKHIQELIRYPQEGVAHYQAIETALSGLVPGIEIPKNTLQADLFLSTKEKHIHKDLIDAVIEQSEDLFFLARESKNPELENFKTRFYTRYEEEEIPLAIALDADLGIGYAGVTDESAGGGELTDDLLITAAPTQNSITIDYIEEFVLSKYNDYLKEHKTCIEITEEEIRNFKKHTGQFRFPAGLHLMGGLLKKDGALDKEHFTFDVSGFGGPSAGNLLGRFTHGNREVSDLTRKILKEEEAEHPEAIYAEIVHLPQARIGNILLRPVLRTFEIPYVGKSGAPADNQIPVDDIMVSIRNNEMVLRSRKHNRRIIPRLTTAHNFTAMSLPVYKFLCDLQTQGNAFPNVWSWGSLSVLKHLPKVTYKNLVLAKAKWQITAADVADLPGESIADIKVFRERHGLPDRVVYTESDNDLLIDFREEQGIGLFLHYLKRYKSIRLEEFLFTEDNCVVTDTQGLPYTNEMIIPLRREVAGNKNTVLQAPPADVRRKFIPGSEWQYFKIYCGSKTAEKILRETILPFIEEGIRTELFERFFFIRYHDESAHFRIRFYNTDVRKQALLQQLFLGILQPLHDAGLIHKIMLDTYCREIERYGAACIADAESLFFNDSIAVLRFIHMLEGDTSDKYRLLFALRGTDMMLDDFGLTIQEKRQLLKSMQAGFFNEAGGQPSLQKQLNEKYRKYQQDIFAHMNPDNDLANEIDEAVAVFEIRSEMNAPVVAAIKARLGASDAEDLTGLLTSYIHMFINRLFIARQRRYELVIYHFLEKYYASRLAILQKSGLSTQNPGNNKKARNKEVVQQGG